MAFHQHLPPHHVGGILLLLMALPRAIVLLSATSAATDQQPQWHYTKRGDLEFSFVRTGNEKKDEVSKGALRATLFFDAEKENRHVFNMDICIDFFDRKGMTQKNRTASVTLCYAGILSPDKVIPNADLGQDAQSKLKLLEKKCANGRKGKNWRGIQLEFYPDAADWQYVFSSVLDQRIYRINMSEFDRDEVRVFRRNQVPKYCFRLEMGQLPPDQEEVAEQQMLVQKLLDGALLDAAANNRADNLTKLFGAVPEVALVVDDVIEEFSLRTVDLTDGPLDAESRVLEQESRAGRPFVGIFVNKTRDRLKENKTLEAMSSKQLYRDFVKKLGTDKNYKETAKNVFELEVHYEGMLHFLNFSFNGGNISPCRTEWVELEKFEMERDFYHEHIHDEFSPIYMAYTVGLVGWKKEADQGFGPGHKKSGKYGPAEEDVDDLRLVLNRTQGFLDLDDRLKRKFADWNDNFGEVFQTLDEYYIPLQLNDQRPLGEITVKQLVFSCSDFTFNLPHVASFTEGSGL